MRDIKFKMYIKVTKKMYEVGKIDFENRKVYMKNSNNYTQSYYYFEDVILIQYTGLRDKNGKEIYEGYKVELDEEIGIIEWNNESSRFVIAFDTWVTDFDHEYGKDLEIVGTIYDNPNLLEKASD